MSARGAVAHCSLGRFPAGPVTPTAAAMRRRLRLAALLLAVAPVALPTGAAPLAAQMPTIPREPEPRHAARWQGEALTLGINAVLGGLTSGAMRQARGRRFRDGFVTGAAGGALTYGGKRLAAERFFAAGLLGRQVAAVGGSVASNAAHGQGALDRVVLPVGPVRVYLVDRASSARVKLDLASTAATVVAALHPDNEFDARESLSAGTPVFRRVAYSHDTGWNGLQAAGVVLVRHTPGGEDADGESAERIGHTAAHERIHVLQYDQTFLLWAAPAEAWALERHRWGRAVSRHVDLGLHVPVWAGLNAVLPYDRRPWEREAHFLTRTAPGHERTPGHTLSGATTP